MRKRSTVILKPLKTDQEIYHTHKRTKKQGEYSNGNESHNEAEIKMKLSS